MDRRPAAALVLVVTAGFAACRRTPPPPVVEAGPAPSSVAVTAPRAEQPPATTEVCPRPAARASLAPRSPVGSAVTLAKVGAKTIALVADADTKTLHTVDVDGGVELAKTPLAGSPSQVLVLPDGRVAVALRDRGAVELLDAGPTLASPLVRSCEVQVPAEPVALGYGAGSLLVVSRWAAKLTALGVPSGADGWSRRAERALGRDPTALAITKERVVVLHATRGVVDDLPLAALGGEGEQPVRSREVVAQVPGQPLHMAKMVSTSFARARVGPPTTLVGTQGYGLAASPEGTVYAALALAAPSPALATGGGYGGGGPDGMSGSMVGEVAVVEPGGELRASPFHGRGGPSDCLLPRAAAFDERSKLLLVACAGLDVVVAYDTRPPRVHLPRKDGRSEALPGERRTPRQAELWRAKVGAGPSGLAVDAEGARAWVWSAFDGALTEVALDDRKAIREGETFLGGDALVDKSRGLRALKLRAASALPSEVERGRVLFHASSPARRIAADGRSCASCHLDGRDDALTWRTDEGPRQTPVLLGRLEGTGPYGWDGDLPLHDHFKRTLKRLGGIGLTDAERDAIFAYVASLAPPSGAAEDDALVQRGREVFRSEEVGCASCHPSGRAVDGLTHDLKARAPTDRHGRFDTPSLRFVGASGPYLHDGRYATLEALLEGTSGVMGNTKQLPADDRRALLAYLHAL